MENRIIELLYRRPLGGLWFGKVRHRAAIENFYTESCVLHVPPSGNKLRKPSLSVGSRQ
jgi:hypothetical protein